MRTILRTAGSSVFCRHAAVLWMGLTVTALARPNLVIFLSDDHGQRDSTPYGATDVRTPNMQRLANDGMVFTQAFVASPTCAPSRAALLTGLMPARNGAEANHSRPRKELKRLPSYLRELGYEVAAFGKVAHARPDLAPYVDYHGNFDISGVSDYLNKRDQSKPLCLLFGSVQPHTPWSENKAYSPDRVSLPPTFSDTPATRQFRCKYYGDVTQTDSELGAIHDIARRQFGNDLVFIYTSDNGAQWPFGKWNLYDSGIATPFIASWPGVIKPGTRSDAMIQWIDLLPTLVDIGGGTPPTDIDGRSFAPVLRGGRTGHRDVIFTTHSGDNRFNVYPMRSARTRDWKYILNLHPEFAYTTHIDQNGMGPEHGYGYFVEWIAAAGRGGEAAATLRRYQERPREELYDLRHDPFETGNLAGAPEQRERLRQMRTNLEDWMKAQGDQQKVFEVPRLLADPAAYAPGTGGREQAAASKRKKKE